MEIFERRRVHALVRRSYRLVDSDEEDHIAYVWSLSAVHAGIPGLRS